MKKGYAKVFSLILCLVCLFSFLPQTAGAASGDEIRAAKKIISVVYDDSGSMQGDRWVYTSYAMQALTAQLNEQDELYITYMSSPGVSSAVDLSSGKIKDSVKKIREWNKAAGTPEQAVITARQKLDALGDKNDTSAQYWLVILTDGEFLDETQPIQQRLDFYKQSEMPNGSGLNVAYLSMGKEAKPITDDRANGLYGFRTLNDADIFDTMSEMSNIVSGRIAVDRNDITLVDNKTVSFSSKLPLYSISVLSQNSKAEVTGANTTEDKNLNLKNVDLAAYYPFKDGASSLKLYGNAAVISKSEGGINKIIPAGTYTITFSEEIKADNLVIQYEPAIALKQTITKDGIEISDMKSLEKGDKVSISIKPVIPGTDTVIDPSDLPKGLTWKIEYIADDNTVAQADGTDLNDVELVNGRGVIKGTMMIPGYAPSEYQIDLDIPEYVYDLSIDVEQPDKLSYFRNALESGSENGEQVRFWLKNEGKRLNREEQEKLDVHLGISDIVCDAGNVSGFFDTLGNVQADCTLVLNDDGSYSLVPKGKIAFTSFMIKAGDYDVKVVTSRDAAISAHGRFSIVPRLADWIDLIILLLIIVFLIYLIFIIFIKYKFKGQIVHYQVYKLLSDGSGVLDRSTESSEELKPLSGHLLLPTRASFMNYRDLKLIAGPDGLVTVTGKSIAKIAYGYNNTSTDPKRGLGSICDCMTKCQNNDKDFEVEDLELSSTPIYFRPAKTGNRIWCVWLEE
ncbi:MAG: VWA domain-containing protein [Clostridia bacterium]|nr:VWA domain-containing protein [Clostridia bacterium]